jgi:hypothetical protein
MLDWRRRRLRPDDWVECFSPSGVFCSHSSERKSARWLLHWALRRGITWRVMEDTAREFLTSGGSSRTGANAQIAKMRHLPNWFRC